MNLLDNLKDDIVFMRGAYRALRMTTPIARHPTRVFPTVIEELAERFGEAPALISDREQLSYRGLSERANRYARWARREGLRKGEAVCLLMPNRPEYMAVWIGVISAGGVAALINTNLIGTALAHCIDIVAPQHVIVAAECAASFTAAQTLMKTRPKVWAHGDGAEAGTLGPRLDHEIDALSGGRLAASERAALTIEDRALYIYTSGTTGLPKAANFSHMRMLFMMSGFLGALTPRRTDRVYIPLPLYHATGGICAVGMALCRGGALIIKRRFSTSEFWGDIHRYEATMFAYIGELCRYLLNAPPGPHETDHRLRAITGNGLRPEIWRAFQARFAIPRILEFYGATEGNVSMLNYDGTVGAVGRVPEYAQPLLPTRVVRFDVETQTPVRGPDGFCVECAPDEAGEAIGGISARAGRGFEGYTKAEETRKKILRDVFRKGDAWFRTGDLMRRDAHSYFYFVDRVGDTFRWKGENVATSEVTQALSAVPGIKEVNVYGVAVPGMEGRAGMAALVVDGDFAISELAARLAEKLPAYARPVFVRLQPEIAVTGTFKQRKLELVKEGFDPALLPDPVYWFDVRSGTYERLTAAQHVAILDSQVKF